MKKMNLRGKSAQPCEYFYHVYHSLCPIGWVSRARGVGGSEGPGDSGRPAELSLRPCLPLAPLQVQRWTEQIKSGTFAGKI